MGLSNEMKAALRKRGFEWQDHAWRKEQDKSRNEFAFDYWYTGTSFVRKIMSIPLEDLPLLLVSDVVSSRMVLWELGIRGGEYWVSECFFPIVEARLEVGV